MKPVALLVLLALPAGAASFKDGFKATSFTKGNTHAHSSASDGDASPEKVLGWYAAHGYGFAALTDHDKLVAAKVAGLVVVPGVEVTSRAGLPGRHSPVHVNALCVREDEAGVTRLTAAQALTDSIARARAGGAAFVVVNHPTWARGVSSSDLLSATGWDAVEVASGHPLVAKDDAAATASAEAMWESALDAGRDVRAVAADDSHDFDGTVKKGEPGLRAPGKAWVSAWDVGATADSVCSALKAGRFYASTGAELESLEVRGAALTVAVADWALGDKVDFVASVPGGHRLTSVSAATARYDLQGDETWVRARVVTSKGRAWTQAFRVDR